MDYLKLINGLFGLSDREMEILETLIEVNDKVIDKDSKRECVKKLGLVNINVFIRKLKDKGAIKGSYGVYTYHPLIALKPGQKGLILSWKVI